MGEQEGGMSCFGGGYVQLKGCPVRVGRARNGVGEQEGGMSCFGGYVQLKGCSKGWDEHGMGWGSRPIGRGHVLYWGYVQ